MKKTMALLLVVLFVVSGCSGGDNKPESNGGGGDGAAQGTSEEASGGGQERFTTDTSNIKSSPVVLAADDSRSIKDTIIFCQASDLTVFDPHRGTQERAYSFTNHIYDTLVEFDEDYQMQPELAESWEVINDGRGLQLKLREGVKFHDGTDFTAKDVEWSIWKRCDMNSTSAYGLVYQDCTIIDDYNIIINFTEPYPVFIYYLGDPAFGIVPEGHTEEMLTADPIGTGPYKLHSYEVGNYYRGEAFEDYWKGDVKTPYIELRIVPEAAQRTILLETGEIDIAYGISYNDISKVTDNSNLELLAGPSMKIFTLYLNQNSQHCPALADARVRKALEMAIDKEALVQAVTYGYGEAVWCLVPNVAAEWIDYPINQYDLEAAQELMKEAGYEDGFDINVWVDSDQMNQETMTILQDQWKKLNVNLSLETQDANTTNARYDAGDDYDTQFWFFQCNSGHISYTLHSTLYSLSSSRNYSQFANAEFDETITEWLKTVDEDVKKEQVRRMFEIIEEETPQIPFYNEMKIIGATNKLAGFRFDRIGAHQLQNAVVYTD